MKKDDKFKDADIVMLVEVSGTRTRVFTSSTEHEAKELDELLKDAYPINGLLQRDRLSSELGMKLIRAIESAVRRAAGISNDDQRPFAKVCDRLMSNHTRLILPDESVNTLIVMITSDLIDDAVAEACYQMAHQIVQCSFHSGTVLASGELRVQCKELLNLIIRQNQDANDKHFRFFHLLNVMFADPTTTPSLSEFFQSLEEMYQMQEKYMAVRNTVRKADQRATDGPWFQVFEFAKKIDRFSPEKLSCEVLTEPYKIDLVVQFRNTLPLIVESLDEVHKLGMDDALHDTLARLGLTVKTNEPAAQGLDLLSTTTISLSPKIKQPIIKSPTTMEMEETVRMLNAVIHNRTRRKKRVMKEMTTTNPSPRRSPSPWSSPSLWRSPRTTAGRVYRCVICVTHAFFVSRTWWMKTIRLPRQRRKL
jgi:hypothetical protein